MSSKFKQTVTSQLNLLDKLTRKFTPLVSQKVNISQNLKLTINRKLTILHKTNLNQNLKVNRCSKWSIFHTLDFSKLKQMSVHDQIVEVPNATCVKVLKAYDIILRVGEDELRVPNILNTFCRTPDKARFDFRPEENQDLINFLIKYRNEPITFETYKGNQFLALTQDMINVEEFSVVFSYTQIS